MVTMRQKVILLVEDELATALIETRQLENEGYRVIHVNTGEKAIEVAVDPGQIVDLILMDIDLGQGIDGTTAAQEILRQRQVPVLFLSSHIEKEVVEKTEKISSYGYVVKNSSFTVLNASLKMAFRLFAANQDIQAQKQAIQLTNEELKATMQQMEAMNEQLNSATSNLKRTIQELQEKEELLESSEARLSQLLTQMPQGLAVHEIICDTKGHPVDYRFLQINASFEEMIGMKSKAVVGKRVLELFPHTEPYWIELYGQVALTGKPHRYENYSTELDKYFSVSAYSPQLGQFAVIATDITASKIAEASLKRSESRYRMLFDLLPLGFSVSDEAGNILESNIESARLLGVPREEHPKRKIDDHEWQIIRVDGTPMPPEEFASTRALKEKMVVDNVEMGIVKGDGLVTWLNVTAAPIPEEGYGVAILYNDITQRKEAAEALLQLKNNAEENEIRFKALHNASFGGIVIHDKGIILDCNQGLSEITGYSQEELIGMDGLLLIAPEMRELVRRNIAAGYEKPYEARGIRKNKEEYPLRLEARMIPYRGKQVRVVEFRDVSEQKQVESLLRESNAYLESLINYANAPIIVWDPDYRITRFNHAFEYLTGLRSQDVLGRSLELLFPAQQVLPSMEMIRKASTGQRWEVVEINIQHTDGSVKTVLWNSATIFSSEDNQPVATIAQGQDITQRKMAESKVQALLQEKELILKEVHHRIKNNMNTILGLLTIQADAQEDPALEGILLDAARRVQSMLVLYDRLYSTGDFNALSLQDYLVPLVHEIVGNFPGGKLVTIDTQVENFKLDTKRLSPLGIILNELLTNAMKHAFPKGAGGAIYVSAHLLEGMVTLIVADNGLGMPEDVDFSRSSGFGMQLVDMLAQQLGGSISLQRGHGARFVLEFPV